MTNDRCGGDGVPAAFEDGDYDEYEDELGAGDSVICHLSFVIRCAVSAAS